jgi:hypothetical protein
MHSKSKVSIPPFSGFGFRILIFVFVFGAIFDFSDAVRKIALFLNPNI